MSAADIRPTCPKCRGTGRVDEDAPVGGLDEMLAAAEERGRRRGVEEQADLLLECEEALVWCSAADAFSPDGIAVKGWQRIVVPVLERIRAVRKNLAPRDSGKEG